MVYVVQVCEVMEIAIVIFCFGYALWCAAIVWKDVRK